MTVLEKFEQWFEGRLAFSSYDKDYVKVMNDYKLWLLIGFEAAKQDSAAEIELLKDKNEYLTMGVKRLEKGSLKLQDENYRLQAENLRLQAKAGESLSVSDFMKLGGSE